MRPWFLYLEKDGERVFMARFESVVEAGAKGLKFQDAGECDDYEIRYRQKLSETKEVIK